MASRKSIAAALLARLNSGGQFVKTGRRDNAPEQAASPNEPGLFLIKPREKYTWESGQRGTPPTRELYFLALIYTDVGTDPNAVPADLQDDLADILDAALAPGAPDQFNNGGRQTLGGLVYDCRIEGEGEYAPGDTQGKGQFALPITVVLNGYP